MVIVEAMIDTRQVLVRVELLIVGADKVQRGSGRPRLLVKIGQGHKSSLGKRRILFPVEDVQRDRIEQALRNYVVGERGRRPQSANRACHPWIRISWIP